MYEFISAGQWTAGSSSCDLCCKCLCSHLNIRYEATFNIYVSVGWLFLCCHWYIYVLPHFPLYLSQSSAAISKRKPLKNKLQSSSCSARTDFFKQIFTKTYSHTFNDSSCNTKHCRPENENMSCSTKNTVNTCEKCCKDFGTNKSREHVLCCQCTWQLDVKQCSGLNWSCNNNLPVYWQISRVSLQQRCPEATLLGPSFPFLSLSLCVSLPCSLSFVTMWETFNIASPMSSSVCLSTKVSSLIAWSLLLFSSNNWNYSFIKTYLASGAINLITVSWS